MLMLIRILIIFIEAWKKLSTRQPVSWSDGACPQSSEVSFEFTKLSNIILIIVLIIQEKLGVEANQTIGDKHVIQFVINFTFMCYIGVTFISTGNRCLLLLSFQSS